MTNNIFYKIRLPLADITVITGFIATCINYYLYQYYEMAFCALLMNLALSHSLGVRLYRRNLYKEALDERQGRLGG